MTRVRWSVRLAAVLVVAAAAGPIAPAGAVRIVEFELPVADSRPLGIAAGPDGNMWFTEVVGSRIGRIKPDGEIGDWSTGSGISTNSRPWGIAAGPDGNMWFTEEVGRVARITASATPVANEFTAGISPNAGPRGIAAGPDGNVWFTEDAGRIGRITPAAQVTEFSNGITSGARPLAIALGADGNLWFTEQADRIGRITPAGVVTEFSQGIAQGSLPSDIAAGPDGNLWFTEYTTGRIGRITPAGVVTEFSAGITPNSQPRGITAGPDGNLWFAEEVGSRIGRITPAGVVTEFPTPKGGNFNASEIAAGPTGDLWYTGGNKIGRLSLDPLVATGVASDVGSSAATIAGTVTPFSSATSYVVEYGRTTAYGTSSAARTLAPGLTARAVSVRLGGLRPDTLYHYRVVASSVAGTSAGVDRTFTTTPGPPGAPAAPDGAPGQPGAAIDRTGPRVRVVRRGLVLDRRGRVAVALRCPLAEPLGCRGTVALQIVPRRAGQAVRVGRAPFRMGAAQTSKIVIRVTRRGRVALRRASRLRGRLVVSAQDAVGNRGRTVTRVSVRRTTTGRPLR